jgi:hypothetical protein
MLCYDWYIAKTNVRINCWNWIFTRRMSVRSIMLINCLLPCWHAFHTRCLALTMFILIFYFEGYWPRVTDISTSYVCCLLDLIIVRLAQICLDYVAVFSIYCAFVLRTPALVYFCEYYIELIIVLSALCFDLYGVLIFSVLLTVSLH